MKIINTYKQKTITWFNYKHLFELKDELHTFSDYLESELKSWITNPRLNISIRKPYDNTTN